MDQVEQFFDAHAGAYHAKKGGMAPFHALTAARIEAELGGRVAAIGGLWAEADENLCATLELTVVDVSPKMLAHWAAKGVRTIQGDARQTPFDDDSLDHVVLPLILHHVTEGSWSAARVQVERVLAEVHRILRPGGKVWISDFSVGTPVYAAQRVASALTRRVLGLAGIPLVIMHPREFYEGVLRELGFDLATTFLPNPASTSWWDLLTPVIGLDWLKVPRVLYPTRPILVSASKRA